MPAGMFHNLTFLARITILSIPNVPMDKDYLFLTRFHVDEIESDSNFDSDFRV